MIKIICDNILNAKNNVIIAHQVNCKNKMNSGVAKTLRNEYPIIFNSYTKYCSKFGSNLLGKIQIVKISQEAEICNMFSQDNYGWDKKYTDSNHFKTCLIKLHDYALQTNKSIAMPYKIGCGRGGGDWNEIYMIIQEIFTESTVTLILYKFNESKQFNN